MHYKEDSNDQIMNVANFTGTYILDNLTPYTEYGVYVTAIRLIGDNGKPLEGMKTITLSERTLAGSKSKEIFSLKLLG